MKYKTGRIQKDKRRASQKWLALFLVKMRGKYPLYLVD